DLDRGARCADYRDGRDEPGHDQVRTATGFAPLTPKQLPTPNGLGGKRAFGGFTMKRYAGINATQRYAPRHLIADSISLLGIAVAVLCLVALVAVSSSVRAKAPVVPDTGGLDCNGLSPLQKPAINLRPPICLDVAPRPGENRADDNGSYIGHD